MPRPSKHVSPDTLGGRIRAAREYLNLSLAEVASGQYSTSLISQIERNRVDPSEESLRFLAERLHIPLKDLQLLAQQNRDTEAEAGEYRSFEEIRNQALLHINNRGIHKALELLDKLQLSQVPALQRWRLAALRGECYFKLRKFLKAQEDFVYAVREQPRPEWIPADQQGELLLLHLHLASTHRELRQLEEAEAHYRLTLQMVNETTPFGQVAEAHWGMALVAFAQASLLDPEERREGADQEKLQEALQHATMAATLYRSIGEHLREAAVTCEIALIQQQGGNIEQATSSLQTIVYTWSHALNPAREQQVHDHADKKRHEEELSILSAAACILADIELGSGKKDDALQYAELARKAARGSYKLRMAEAAMMYGRVRADMDDPRAQAEAEQAFRDAIAALEKTDRIAARIDAHQLLSRHLLRLGRFKESEEEFQRARSLFGLGGATATSKSEAIEEELLV